MPTGSSQTPITSALSSQTAGGVTIPLVRLWVEAYFARRQGWRLPRRCLLDTGAPVSVIPFTVHRAHDFAWMELPGPWHPMLTTWEGVPCRLGQVQVWLPVATSPIPRGPFPFVAKFPERTPRRFRVRRLVPPVILGLNFFAQHFADLSFRCHTPPQAGMIALP